LKTGLKSETTILEINSSYFGAWSRYLLLIHTIRSWNPTLWQRKQLSLWIRYLHYGNCIGASTYPWTSFRILNRLKSGQRYDITFWSLKSKIIAGFFLQRRSSCVVANLYNVLYSVTKQLYISTVILYVHSDHIMTTCFDPTRSSSGQYRTFLMYNKVSTQWDPISFTVRVKIMYDETCWRF